MRYFLFLFSLFLLGAPLHAQKPDDVLATANGLTFTAGSLSAEVQKAYLNQNAAVAAERSDLFAAFVRSSLLEAEMKASGLTRDALIDGELKKVPAPSEAEIKQVYDSNRQALGDLTLEQARPQILGFLRNGAEQRTVNALVERLKTKHKFAAGKDVNSPGLTDADVIFTIAGKPFTAGEFNERSKPFLYDVKAEIIHHAQLDLTSSIYSTLLSQEAKARNMEPGDLIAAEITNKLKDFSNEERAALEEALRKRLFDKYAVKVMLREPEPAAHDVSADDDPIFGKAAAPVTVVMFSDFQCSACAATHPILKQVLAAYPEKARFVVRDFPLESIHENAFAAARAANAAHSQGKYFEYIDLLYQNQDKLDAASLRAYAASLGLNLKRFELDFTSEKAAAEIRSDMADGVRHGARGTPTIFINGVRVNHLSSESFRGGIEKALARPASK